MIALLMVATSAYAAESTAPHSHDHHATPAATGSKLKAVLPMTDAEVRKVDAKAGKLTLRHGRLENLDMAPMTMVFGVKDPAWLVTLKAGDKMRVAVDRVNGTLTVVALEPAR
jgi:Cu/Ag efflux protein CusF